TATRLLIQISGKCGAAACVAPQQSSDGTKPDPGCQRRLREGLSASESASGAGLVPPAAPDCSERHSSTLRSVTSFNIDQGVCPSRLFNWSRNLCCCSRKTLRLFSR